MSVYAVAAMLVFGLAAASGVVFYMYSDTLDDTGDDTVEPAGDIETDADEHDDEGLRSTEDEAVAKGTGGSDVGERLETIDLEHRYSIPESEKPWFVDVAEERELFGEFTVEELEGTGTQEGEHGSGVYVLDHDDSGREDLVGLVNYTPVLFENTGDGFRETDEIDVERDVFSVLVFDHDNSGDEDIYLLSNEGSLFLENAGGEFHRTENGLEIGYDSVRGADAADYTGNGCLDVFVIQANDWRNIRPAGYDGFVSNEEDNGNPNRLFEGSCGEFEETTEEAGITGSSWSLATSFVDLDGTGRPDIHVANDFNNDVVYWNEGDRTFTREVLPHYTDRNGMSSETADVTGNGYLDIFVSNIYAGGTLTMEKDFAGRVEGNNLLVNHGNRSFSDAAGEFGVRRGGWGWAALFEDFTNDGDLELYQATTDYVEKPNLFWSQTDEAFELVTGSSFGLNGTEDVGAVALDYDADGSLDMVHANAWHPNRFYLLENQRREGNWLRLNLQPASNQTDIGAEVEVEAGDESWRQVQDSRADYLSQSSRKLHFGLGDHDQVDEVKVTWPDGVEETHEDVDVNQELVVSPDGSMQPR